MGRRGRRRKVYSKLMNEKDPGVESNDRRAATRRETHPYLDTYLVTYLSVLLIPHVKWEEEEEETERTETERGKEGESLLAGLRGSRQCVNLITEGADGCRLTETL